jgi:tetratricopeptide (TPR) repeat protein
MLNFRINRYQDLMEESVGLAIDTGRSLLKTSDDPWLHLYIGGAYGYRALHRFRQSKWIGAYLDGRKGIENFREALRREPGLHDCYFGLGSYNYWRTAKSRLVRIVTFWLDDNRQLGLEQMRLALDSGYYSSREAAYGLVIAYYDNGDFDEALELNDEIMAYNDPPSLGALYMRGRLMAHYERWPEVEVLNRRILERLDDQSIGYRVECKYWIAVALHAMDRSDEAYAMTREALQQSRMRDNDAELESAIEGFPAIEKRLVELNGELRALRSAMTRAEDLLRTEQQTR